MEETSTLDTSQNTNCTTNIEDKESPYCDIFEPTPAKIQPIPSMTFVLREHDQASMEEVDDRSKNTGDCGSKYTVLSIITNLIFCP